jgi:hypothetical protein
MSESLENSYNQDGSRIKLGLAHFYQSFEDLKLLSANFITNSERVNQVYILKLILLIFEF